MRLTIDLDAAAAAFYTRVAESARLPLETVVADALFKLAGELRRGQCAAGGGALPTTPRAHAA